MHIHYAHIYSIHQRDTAVSGALQPKQIGQVPLEQRVTLQVSPVDGRGLPDVFSCWRWRKECQTKYTTHSTTGFRKAIFKNLCGRYSSAPSTLVFVHILHVYTQVYIPYQPQDIQQALQPPCTCMPWAGFIFRTRGIGMYMQVPYLGDMYSASLRKIPELQHLTD